MSKLKIEIKDRWFGNILFEYEKENNTLKETLEKAVEEGAYLYGADLKGADLEEANLEGAYLKGANLKGAYLKRADLEGAYLKEANLEGANLRGANLRGANLEGVNLKGVKLRGAKLRGAIIFYTDDPIENINDIIDNFIKDSNIKTLTIYENHNQIPTRWNIIWKNVLIINEYTIKELEEPEVKEMTVAEISKALGYEVKVVKD